jgi:hypothetical protein
MAVNAEERHNTGTRRAHFTTFRVKKLHSAFRADIEGIEILHPWRKQLAYLQQQGSLANFYSSKLCYDAGCTVKHLCDTTLLSFQTDAIIFRATRNR